MKERNRIGNNDELNQKKIEIISLKALLTESQSIIENNKNLKEKIFEYDNYLNELMKELEKAKISQKLTEEDNKNLKNKIEDLKKIHKIELNDKIKEK